MSRSHRRVEAVVVGGGISGASLLYYLARRGFESILLERQTFASGPTGVSSANCRLHYIMPELAELARRSFQVMSDFRSITGVENGFVRTGVLYGVGPDEAEAYKASVVRHRTHGSPIELLSPSEMLGLVPGFDLSGIEIGVWEPTSGYTDPAMTTVGLIHKAQELGAEALVDCEVVDLITARGRVAEVRLADGTAIRARYVLVAAGPWTRRLVARIGVELPMQTERHSVSVLDAPEGSRRLLTCIWEDRPNSYYMRPEGDRTLLLGGPTSRDLPVSNLDAWDRTVKLEESVERLGRAVVRIPGVEGLGIRRAYAGLIDNTPDRLHLVGEVPGAKGLVVMAGSSGHGYKLAPAIAEELVEHLGKRASVLLKPFAINRSFDPAANPDVSIKRPAGMTVA